MIGKTLGHYRILAQLGAGGMGEVFRATDTTLGREVAVKLLPLEFASDSERLKRFQREASLLASLNHSNIATLHGLEAESGVHFLVMELVEGEDLSTRIARGPLGVRETLDIARQIAASLRAAHEKGIVHRDLKPGNIRVTEDGTVKVLDFGLAKAMTGESAASDLSQSPTILSGAHTQAGVILGTAAYMSPEQARGRPVDARTDVWSFGCVLFECLTGKQPFPGETVTDILARILEREPDWNLLPAATSPGLRMVLKRCLEKDVRRRWRDMGDVGALLEDESLVLTGVAGDAVPAKGGRRSLWIGVASGLVGGVLAAALLLRGGASEGPATDTSAAFKVSIVTLQGGLKRAPVFSPDGGLIAYTLGGTGGRDILLQRSGGATPINLTPNSPSDDYAPAFSRDGEHIAFRSTREGGGLYVMGATGESLRRISEHGFDPCWSPTGNELVVSSENFGVPTVRNGESDLWVMDVATGERRLLVNGDCMQPDWSPSGARIAYWGMAVTEGGQRDIWTVAASGGTPVRVLNDGPVDWMPRWSHDGRWLYFLSARGGSFNLWRIGIDEESGTPRGEPEPVTLPCGQVLDFDFSANDNRVLYTSADRTTRIMRAALGPGGSSMGAPELVLEGAIPVVDIGVSFQGETIAYRSHDEEIGVVRSDGSDVRRITNDTFRDRGPSWSPDGSRIIFYSDRSGNYQIHTMRRDGSDIQQITELDTTSVWYPQYSPDGTRILVYDAFSTAVFAADARNVKVADFTLVPQPPHGGYLDAVSWLGNNAVVGMEESAKDVMRAGVMVYSFATGAYTRHAESIEFARCVGHRDGRHVIAITPDGDCYQIDTVGNGVRKLGRTGDADATVLPADGSYLYYINSDARSNVWVATWPEGTTP